MKELWMLGFVDPPRHHLVEQATEIGRGGDDDGLSNGAFVGLLAGSCVSVWAVAGGLWYLSQKKKEEADPQENKPLVAENVEETEEKAGSAVGMSSLSVLLSVPALFAHWCWPVIVGALLGGAAEFFTPKARAIGHALFWGLNFGMFVVMCMYVFNKSSKKKEENLTLKWGPFALIALGAMLVMVDLTRHVLLDLELAGEELAMYNEFGELSKVGLFGVYCTWVGVISVAAGIVWFANVPGKFMKFLEERANPPMAA